MTNGTIMRLAALAGAMLLAGCLGGGGGGGGTLSVEDIDKVRSDSRIVRMRGIYERADTLLIPGVYLEFTTTTGGRRGAEEDLHFSGTCSGTDCDLSGSGGRGTIALEELITEDVVIPSDIGLTKLEIGKRDGFDTLVVEGRDRISEKLSDETITAAGSTTSWGVWGKYGYAAVEIIEGSLGDDAYSLGMNGAVAYVFGDRNPTNPGGTGSATWQGPAEAASTRTFTRYPGKATLTIPDLALPRIGAEIEVDGNDISAPSWKDMALSRGHFTAGTVGQDYMAGNFHGSDHEEAYGVFDTGAYVGAFGAMRK